jgi:cbb3-type cytochrome oxidase subunit 3
MYTAFYKASEYVSLSNVGMLFFFCVFAGVIAWLFIEPREEFDEASRLPLQDDEGTLRAGAPDRERIP